ncbi:MAG: hypothetical protein ABH873_05905 [Candidatus Firestonebacteria bacterium]
MENINLKAIESKVTSGGYIAIYEMNLMSYDIKAELNISTRIKGEKFIVENQIVTSELYPTYNIVFFFKIIKRCPKLVISWI